MQVARYTLPDLPKSLAKRWLPRKISTLRGSSKTTNKFGTAPSSSNCSACKNVRQLKACTNHGVKTCIQGVSCRTKLFMSVLTLTMWKPTKFHPGRKRFSLSFFTSSS